MQAAIAPRRITENFGGVIFFIEYWFVELRRHVASITEYAPNEEIGLVFTAFFCALRAGSTPPQTISSFSPRDARLGESVLTCDLESRHAQSAQREHDRHLRGRDLAWAVACGREERSRSPAAPWARKRATRRRNTSRTRRDAGEDEARRILFVSSPASSR